MVILGKALVDPFALLGGAQIGGQVWVVTLQADLESHVPGLGRYSSSGVVVVIGCRFRPFDIAEHVRMAGSGREGTMRGLVLVQQAEWLRAAAAQEVEGEVGRNVGGIAGLFALLPVDDEVGIEVHALSGQHLPFVESAGLLAQVPFSNQAGAISGLLEQLRKCRQAGVEFFDGIGLLGIASDAVDVGIAAGQDRCTARSAEGVGAASVGKARALAGQAVHVRRLQQRMARAAHLGVLLVVGHHQQDVGTWRGSASAPRQKRRRPAGE